MSAWAYLAAILACGVGALGRYALGLARKPHHLPWPTLAANVVGSAVLGAAAGAVHNGAPAWVLVVAGAGLAGGITTFSSLALDAVTLWGGGRRRGAVGYLAATMALGVVAAWLGWLLAV
jgi:CrcB protein